MLANNITDEAIIANVFKKKEVSMEDQESDESECHVKPKNKNNGCFFMPFNKNYKLKKLWQRCYLFLSQMKDIL